MTVWANTVADNPSDKQWTSVTLSVTNGHKTSVSHVSISVPKKHQYLLYKFLLIASLCSRQSKVSIERKKKVCEVFIKTFREDVEMFVSQILTLCVVELCSVICANVMDL